ncbi:amidophosphoribosyltransferase [bacterium]|nr:amidophosphoribosyltransferase [bacterium]
MSDYLTHECGIAMVRLLKPLSHYLDKYGTALYGLHKMYLLMEKQHNRGQDGAGLANIKFDVEPGQRYISRYRSVESQPIQDIFGRIQHRIEERVKDQPEKLNDPAWLKANLPFTGELYLGHLRYGTYGGNSIENCHPFLRQNNWMTRNLVLAGNFNMTNVDLLFQQLVDLGQHPKEKADTVTILERIGHFLDEENEDIYKELKRKGLGKAESSQEIARKINVGRILRKSAKKWDGGYAMAGLFGHGDAFVLRDPSGIRPAFYYTDDEVVVVASERPVIQTAFNVPYDAVHEIEPGQALIVKKSGKIKHTVIKEPLERTSCSFERIYFSRGSDADVYRERIELGRRLVPSVLKTVENDLENTVFSFIPNTAEVAFYGMVKGIEDWLDRWKAERIRALPAVGSEDELVRILAQRPRAEKVAWKDVKMRTFISSDQGRDDLVSHVYDITYGSVRPNDRLVVIDDSIVRGTTLRKSILRILARLEPRSIAIVSSAPQIRYPDCYGIDMARIGDLVAFQAAESLHRERGTRDALFDAVYRDAKRVVEDESTERINHVQRIYADFTDAELSQRIAELLTPEDFRPKLDILFQTVDDLHAACPQHTGDWYFTGNYPTPGGTRVANKAFVYYMEGRKERAY